MFSSTFPKDVQYVFHYCGSIDHVCFPRPTGTSSWLPERPRLAYDSVENPGVVPNWSINLGR